MFKKRSKKALSHVDWAISLAIFLIYLSWFFIYVKPMFTPTANMDVLLNILDDGLEQQIFRDVSRVKLFIPGSVSSSNEPVVVDFPYAWESSKIAHSADYFVLDDGKMFFMANLSNSTMYRMYYPYTALTTRPVRRIMADDSGVTSGSFNAYFENYLLNHASYLGLNRIYDYSVSVDDTVIGGTGSFINSTFLAKYKSTGDYVNISSYLFADDSKIFNYIRPSDHLNHSVVIEFATYNYTAFYFDPTRNGELKYSILPACKYYKSDYLDLYDSTSGLLLTFNRNISFKLCTNETTPTVSMEFDVYSGREDNFNMIIHSGGLDSAKKYPLHPVLGTRENLRTVSAKQVALLKGKDYDYLKQLFSYPKANQFNITITSDIVSASYGIEQTEISDIFARKIEGIIIDERYQPKRALITLTVW